MHYALLCVILINLRSTQHKQQILVAIYGAGSRCPVGAALRLVGNPGLSFSMTTSLLDSIHQRCGYSTAPGVEGSEDTDQVLLAIPSLSRSERRRIIDNLHSYGIPVLQVPSSMTSRPAVPHRRITTYRY